MKLITQVIIWILCMFALALILITHFSSADIISLNSGGDSEFVLTPEGLIEGFWYSDINYLNVTPYENYSDVLLICNYNSSDSLDICNYFTSKRLPMGFDISHILYLNVSTEEVISVQEYVNIYQELEAVLNSSGRLANDTINYLVTTSGIPLKFNNGSDSYSVDSFLGAYNATNLSKVYVTIFVTAGKENPYYGSFDNFSYAKYKTYLTTRLDGVTLEDVHNLIDNGFSQNLTGMALIDCMGSKTYNLHTHCQLASNLTEYYGITTNYNPTDSLVFKTNLDNISIYYSMGSNSGGPVNSSTWNLTFNPGAIGETAVSKSAFTMRGYGISPAYQSSITDLIKGNITGIKGYVSEPYTTSLADPVMFIPAYLSGRNLADSLYSASFNIAWKAVYIGDPKTRIVFNATKTPYLSVASPINSTYYSTNYVIIDVTAISPYGIDSLWFFNSTANVTISYRIAFLYSLGGGNYTFIFYANDSLNNVAQKTVSFTINTTSIKKGDSRSGATIYSVTNPSLDFVCSLSKNYTNINDLKNALIELGYNVTDTENLLKKCELPTIIKRTYSWLFIIFLAMLIVIYINRRRLAILLGMNDFKEWEKEQKTEKKD